MIEIRQTRSSCPPIGTFLRTLVVGTLAIGLMLPQLLAEDAWAQTNVCDTPSKECCEKNWIDDMNEQIAMLNRQKGEILLEVDKYFQDAMMRDKAEINKSHVAAMEEIARERAALKGDHFEKSGPSRQLDSKIGKRQERTREQLAAVDRRLRDARAKKMEEIKKTTDRKIELVRDKFERIIAKQAEWLPMDSAARSCNPIGSIGFRG